LAEIEFEFEFEFHLPVPHHKANLPLLADKKHNNRKQSRSKTVARKLVRLSVVFWNPVFCLEIPFFIKVIWNNEEIFFR